jgi:hypothetical protein
LAQDYLVTLNVEGIQEGSEVQWTRPIYLPYWPSEEPWWVRHLCNTAKCEYVAPYADEYTFKVTVVSPDGSRCEDEISVDIPERNNLKRCSRQRQQALRYVDEGMMDGFIPQCTIEGNYEAKQCYGFFPFCACVDRMSGEMIYGSMRPMWMSLDCNRAVSGGELGKCEVDVYERYFKDDPWLMAFPEEEPDLFPQCDDKGDYLRQQTDPKTGETYCVNTQTGDRLSC